MPINRDLNVAPYFDDFDITKQFHRVLFKPSYAVQARELIQMQTMLQNQIEQFGDNIFKEGSIIKGCNFTELSDLSYVKLTDVVGFDPTQYVGFTDTITISGIDYVRDNTYELEGVVTGVRATVVAATRGFETRNPDLNTFFINYITTSVGDNAGNKVFQAGERLRIYRVSVYEQGTSVQRPEPVEVLTDKTINVTTFSGAVGNSFGLKSAPGIIFQKGHFLYAEEQLAIVSKYSNVPNNVSIGYTVEERVINAFQDSSLFDNANGSFNQNAPGADRLKLIPTLTVLPTTEADADNTFFTLTRYVNGNAVLLRDVSQYNVLGEEMARRTYEESGDYIVNDFQTTVVRRDGNLKASVGSGVAYVKGHRVENLNEVFLDIADIPDTSVETRINQGVSFNYGGYLDILDVGAGGNVPLGTFATVSLRDGGNSVLGTARVRNITDTKIFLFDIRLSGANRIAQVERVVGTSGYIPVANTSTIKETTSSAMVFDTGMISLKSTSNRSIPVRASKTITGTATTFNITPDNVGEDFNLENDDIIFIDNSNIRRDVTSAVLSGADLQVTIGATPSSPSTIYYNKRIISANPFTKISADLYVKCSFANTDIASSTARYNLGFPDVYEIVSITDSASKNVTSSFELKTNQRDNFYDHSYIEYIPGRPVPAVGLMTVHVKAFKLNDTTGNYFFTVDSYPAAVAKNKIQPFVSSSGKVYNLRDCFDFRPYVEPLSPATYTNAALLATAPTVSSGATGVNVAPSFSGSYTIITPSHDQFGEIDYEFYLNRTDAVILDSYGRISLIKGTEVENSVPPSISGDQIKIAEIYVPGSPALTPEEANAQDRPQYAVKIVPKGTKSYRMKDIENLEKKIDSLEYYVLLNTLEADTKNLNIVDENGLDRFKNGIIVDPFNDLSIANLENVEFNAALDFSEQSLMPSVKTFPLNLKYKSASTATLFPTTTDAKVGTLQRNTDVSIISQPYATEFRNCVSNFYSYRGIGDIVPEYDSAPDTVANPINISVNRRGGLAVTRSSRSIQELLPLTSTNRLDTTSDRRPRPRIVNTNQQRVGDFVTNVNFNPFMRPRDIRIYMSGLRPNTRHYFFFDEEDVNQFVFPGSNVNTADLVRRRGNAAAEVKTDANGVLRAVFSLPASRFYVGDRKLEIVDVDTYAAIESASTSYGFVTYRAYNFSVEKTSLTVSTRRPRPTIGTIRPTVTPTLTTPTATTAPATTDRNVVRRPIINDTNRGPDPIAQTFFIKSGMGLESDTVFVSKVDLYFKRSSTINGVTVELREVVNGYPSYDVLPFSRVHLTPQEVLTSDDASVETTVTFKAPVRLDVEKEYAVVVIPDAADPDYLIFTSKVGGVDLTPGANQGLPIVQDWGDGVLFTSTNNRAWKSYQDEDVKFTLYRHNFNATTGSITLTNDDHEFLSTENNIGTFKVGETVYKLEAKDGSTGANLSAVSGNNQISGTSLSATYSAGDFVLLSNGTTNRQIFKVVSANSTVIVADQPAYFTESVSGSPITMGILRHYDFRYPNFIILEESSATSTRKFVAGDTIYGFDSAAATTIDTVDNVEFSYIQPVIHRTNDSITTTSLSGTIVDPANPGDTYSLPMQFNDKALFSKTGMVVYSKSNDIAREKTLDLTVTMSNNSNVTSSPFIDIETASILAYQWKITNDSATTSKYVSKTVELAENLDAEDFRIYVTGYRPRGTDIKVFIKVQSADDPTVFETNDWIELELTSGVNLYSSVSNTDDFKEYMYQVSDLDKNFGVITYTNDIGTFEGYRRFAIKIELHSEDIFKAPRLLDYRGISLT